MSSCLSLRVGEKISLSQVCTFQMEVVAECFLATGHQLDMEVVTGSPARWQCPTRRHHHVSHRDQSGLLPAHIFFVACFNIIPWHRYAATSESPNTRFSNAASTWTTPHWHSHGCSIQGTPSSPRSSRACGRWCCPSCARNRSASVVGRRVRNGASKTWSSKVG